MPTARQIAQRRLRLHRQLSVAQAKLVATDPARYAQTARPDQYYQAVLTTRQHKVRQLERLLEETEEPNVRA